MNKKVFVIGAGAHSDFGMPTGFQLTENLLLCQKLLSKIDKNLFFNTDFHTPLSNEINSLKYVNEITKDRVKNVLNDVLTELQNLSFLDRDEQISNFIEFIRLFDQSGQSSIDAFLSEQDSKGRHADKYFKGFLGLIIQSMQEFAIKNHFKPNWIRRLLSIIDIESLTNPNYISFITFNYDTILEDIIYDYLKAQHGMSHEDATDHLAKIDIKHVYGKIPSKLLLRESIQHVTFENKDIPSTKSDYYLIKSNNEINIIRNLNSQIISDGIISKMALEHSKKLVSAKLINKMDLIFLGFGFDPINIKILLSKMPDELKPNYLTTTKLSQGQLQKAVDRVQPFTGDLIAPYEIGLSIEDVLFDTEFLDQKN